MKLISPVIRWCLLLLASAVLITVQAETPPKGAQSKAPAAESRAKTQAPDAGSKAPAPKSPTGGTQTPKPPELAAKAYVLMDYASGRILAESNGDQRLEPASLTKIMTAHVVLRAIHEGRVNLTDEVLISEKAWRTGGSKTFVEIGNRIPMEVLLKGMIVQSGNDASVALAEHVAGGEGTFAELMNTEAQRLGLANSHFMNATGLPDPQHYSTARDLAVLAAATIREFPDYYSWYAIKEFTYHNIKQENRNRLLWQDSSVDGVKTGHTETAGYCLVASAKRDGTRLISVVMGMAGEKVRAKASLELLTYGFNFFETRELYPADQPVQTVRVYKGAITDLPVGPHRTVAATVPKGQGDKVSARVELEPKIIAPISKGQTVGNVILTLGEAEIGRVPLIALEEVPTGGFWRRLIDTILLWFR